MSLMQADRSLMQADRVETADVVGPLIARLSDAPTLFHSIEIVASGLMRCFGASRALLVGHDAGSRRSFLWDARATPGSEHVDLQFDEPVGESASLATGLPPGDWALASPAESAEGSGGVGGYDLYLADTEAVSWSPTPFGQTEALRQLTPFRTVLSVLVSPAPSWSARVILCDPRAVPRDPGVVDQLRAIAERIAPVLLNVYVFRHLRPSIRRAEQTRVARELHDGVLQSLIGIEMRLQVVRERAAVETPAVAGELAELQALMHDEIIGVRELMAHLRPIEIRPSELRAFLADTADRFQRETGITTSFLSPVDDETVSPELCQEVARIVQEALVNVRRHSDARHVMVRFSGHPDRWELVVDDDGQGFPFAGRLTLDQLDRTRRGPVVIKERVRAIGGQLTIDSNPGHGARLTVTIPRRRHA